MTSTILANQFAALPNGMRLHYASAGERGRPLILFVHGFPEFWYAWEAQLAEFGRDFFAVAPDLRGFNLSSMPTEVSAYKAALVADDLRLLASHLGYEKCVVVAHDWGGAAAWNLAITMPSLLNRLVIINSPHPYLFARALVNDPQQAKASAYMNWLRKEGSEEALAKNDFALLDNMVTGTDGGAGWFTPQVRARYHACWSRGLTGPVNYYRASPLYPPQGANDGPLRLTLLPDDFRVRAPVRVIWGMRDMALLPGQLDGLEHFIDDLKVERIDDGSHWVVHEQPQRINHLLRMHLCE